MTVPLDVEYVQPVFDIMRGEIEFMICQKCIKVRQREMREDQPNLSSI